MQIQFNKIEDILDSLLSADNNRRSAANDFVDKQESQIIEPLISYIMNSSNLQLQYLSLILLRALLKNERASIDGYEKDIFELIQHTTRNKNRLIRKGGYIFASSVRRQLRKLDIDLLNTKIRIDLNSNDNDIELYDWLANTLEEDYSSNNYTESLERDTVQHLQAVLLQDFNAIERLNSNRAPFMLKLMKSLLLVKGMIEPAEKQIYTSLVKEFDKFGIEIQNCILELSFTVLEIDKNIIEELTQDILKLLTSSIHKFYKDVEFMNPGKLSLLFLWKILSEGSTYDPETNMILYIKQNITDFVNLLINCCIFTEADFQSIEKTYNEPRTKIGEDEPIEDLLEDKDNIFEYSEDYTYRFLASRIIEELLFFIPDNIVDILKNQITTLITSDNELNQERAIMLIGLIESKAGGTLIAGHYCEVLDQVFTIMNNYYMQYINKKDTSKEVIISTSLWTIQIVVESLDSDYGINDKYLDYLLGILYNIKHHSNIVNSFYMDCLISFLKNRCNVISKTYEKICNILLNQIESDSTDSFLRQIVEFLILIIDIGDGDIDDPFSEKPIYNDEISKQNVKKRIAETIKNFMNNNNFLIFIPLISRSLDDQYGYFDDILPQIANESIKLLSSIAETYISSLSKIFTRLNESEMENQLTDLLEFLVEFFKYLNKSKKYKLESSTEAKVIDVCIKLLKSPVRLIRSFIYSTLADILIYNNQLNNSMFFNLLDNIEKDLDFDELDQDAANSNQILFNNCAALLVLLCEQNGTKIAQQNLLGNYIKKLHRVFIERGKLNKVLAFNLTRLTLALAKLNPELIEPILDDLIKPMAVALFVFKSKHEETIICANIVLLTQLIDYFVIKYKKLLFINAKNFAFILELLINSMDSRFGFTDEGKATIKEFCYKIAKDHRNQLIDILKENSPKVQQEFASLCQ